MGKRQKFHPPDRPIQPTEVEVRFHAITSNGDAVGRDASGKTIFSPFGAPNDLARVRLTEDKKAFARGEIIQLLEPGPGRAVPPCPYFKPEIPEHSCGGCQLQHLSYAAQLEAKRRIVHDALERIGGFRGESAVAVEACLPSPNEWNYRNKADLVVGVRKGRPEVGFYVRESHRLVDVEQCPIQGQANNQALVAVRALLAARPEWAFDPARGTGELRRVVLRSTATGACFVHLVTQRARWLEGNEFASRLAKRLPNLAGVTQRIEGDYRSEPHLLKGSVSLEEEVSGLALTARSEAFLQVNPSASPLLVDLALEMAQVQTGIRALDLYCGVGMFALAMARAGAQVLGIEANPGAIVSAKENARRLSLDAQFIAGDVTQELAKLNPGSCEVILLDPPRAGAAEAIPELLHLAPNRIVYVSCDPATLARDLRVLADGGYEVKRVVPVDMFPQTGHVETIVALSR